MNFQTRVSGNFLAPNRSSKRPEKALINHLLLLLKQSKSTKLVQQIHTQILIHSIPMPMPNYLLSKIIELKHFAYSTLLFPQIPPNSYAFNVMIRGLATSWEKFDSALDLFARMKNLGVRPDNFTYPFVSMSCGSLEALGVGKSVHCEVWKCGLLVDFHVANSLITMYARCREVGFARKVFDEMMERDLVSWNSIISGYSRLGCAGEAVDMFGEMREWGVEPDEMTLVSVLAACGDLGDLGLGGLVEEHVVRKGMELNSYIGSALINMYGKCGELESARRVFDGMKKKEIVIWNSMITGYAQNGQSDETLSLFNAMKETGPEPNEITLIAVLSACASIGALDLGIWIDKYASERGFHHNIYVGTALVDMYAKCGNLEYASRVFEDMPVRNEVSWNTIISAHAFNGRAEDALTLFQRMLEEKGLCPDDITFIGVLSACVHAGLVDEGRRLFDLMSSLFKLTPKVEHYSCLVDLLSRAGRVYEAWDFIQKMPQKPDEILLGALLVSCQKLKNVDIGERVSQLLLEMEPSNSGNYIISSNIYADVRRWEDCARMRTLMKQKGVTKTPGCSWIETDGHLREFHAGDFLIEDAEDIHRALDMLYDDMALEYGEDVELSRDVHLHFPNHKVAVELPSPILSPM
ncbi:pentatricopeptide repeat-containing protein At2g34400-like [Salvia splendens]|uniref:pentatricopeptide repeat-containing protein At2g34400-like n=1 Tax=Salvia splendens TaxID=180675 RepID=UPI001101AA3D|nr:pentatricopeptide repeat-containing protein At2g34400-like [Salvia splendens]XP_042031598.1 pentatricopeptide repeat-containing protein At2g34400-like [Salvia splendens]